MDYDPQGRLAARTRATPDDAQTTTTYTHDPFGRVLQTTTTAHDPATNQTLTQTTSNTYDYLGQLLTATDSAGLTTTYTYDTANRAKTTALPGGATRTTTNYLDGQTKSITGDALIHQHLDYGVLPATNQTWTQTTLAKPDGPRWTRTYTNFLGQTAFTEHPGYQPGTTLLTTSTFDRGGRLTTSQTHLRDSKLPYTDPKSILATVGAATHRTYDQLNQPTLTGLDLDGDGILTAKSTDRLTQTQTSYHKTGPDWFQLTRAWTFPKTDNPIPTLTAKTARRLTGLPAEPDPTYGRLISETTTYNPQTDQPAATTKTYRKRDTATTTVLTTNQATGQTTTRTTVAGRLLSRKSSDQNSTFEIRHSYDPLGRRVATIDPRTGATKTEYHPETSQITAQIDAAGNRTQYTYYGPDHPNAGRLKTIANPAGKLQHIAYNQRGQRTAIWGQTAYPITYEYDAYGQLITQHTHQQEPSNPQTSDLPTSPTTWTYQEATGLLLAKTYPDGKGPEYSYTPAGQLKTRTWARGDQTTYTYHPKTSQLASISENQRPLAVSYSYGRSGNLTTVTDQTGARSFTRDNLGRELTETLPNGWRIERKYDLATNRLSNVTLIDPTDEKVHQTAYNWNPTGTLASVASGAGHFDYAYHPENPSLLTSLTGPGAKTSYEYEPTRNLLTNIETISANQRLSAVSYKSDEAGRRTEVAFAGDAFQNPGWEWNYNGRSEVTGARPRKQDLGNWSYQYDAIGNRIEASEGKQQTAYTTNDLNQYTSISEAQRPSLVKPTYDPDGNLLEDARATYAWNANNRLAQVQLRDGTRVTNTYDYMGRRVKKQVIKPNGAHTATSFIYDGWNVIAEIRENSELNTHQSTFPTTHQSTLYTWGRDLSGTLQGAGGVGGLLAITTETKETHYPSYDGNGNIIQLTNSDGGIVATYEYDPFGNIIHQSGPEADNNPWRFSTKHFDDETGLLYYGFRYYSTKLGRWASRDPIEERGGENLYGFVANAPIDAVDHLGKAIAAGDTCSGRPCKFRFWMVDDGSDSEKAKAKLESYRPDDCGPCHLVEVSWWVCTWGFEDQERIGRRTPSCGWRVKFRLDDSFPNDVDLQVAARVKYLSCEDHVLVEKTAINDASGAFGRETVEDKWEFDGLGVGGHGYSHKGVPLPPEPPE